MLRSKDREFGVMVAIDRETYKKIDKEKRRNGEKVSIIRGRNQFIEEFKLLIFARLYTD